MTLYRSHDWPSKLLRTVDAGLRQPMVWGQADCCMFACDCILAMTGVDPAAWFRGRYTTKAGARRALKTFAGAGLVATVERITRELAMPEISPATAQRGDLVLITEPLAGPDPLALAICVGQYHAAQGAHGVVLAPLARGLRAWRV